MNKKELFKDVKVRLTLGWSSQEMVFRILRGNNLSLVLGNVVEKIYLASNSKNMKDKKVVKSSQYGYVKEKSYFNSLSEVMI